MESLGHKVGALLNLVPITQLPFRKFASVSRPTNERVHQLPRSHKHSKLPKGVFVSLLA